MACPFQPTRAQHLSRARPHGARAGRSLHGDGRGGKQRRTWRSPATPLGVLAVGSAVLIPLPRGGCREVRGHHLSPGLRMEHNLHAMHGQMRTDACTNHTRVAAASSGRQGAPAQIAQNCSAHTVAGAGRASAESASEGAESSESEPRRVMAA